MPRVTHWVDEVRSRSFSLKKMEECYLLRRDNLDSVWNKKKREWIQTRRQFTFTKREIRIHVCVALVPETVKHWPSNQFRVRHLFNEYEIGLSYSSLHTNLFVPRMLTLLRKMSYPKRARKKYVQAFFLTV